MKASELTPSSGISLYPLYVDLTTEAHVLFQRQRAVESSLFSQDVDYYLSSLPLPSIHVDLTTKAGVLFQRRRTVESSLFCNT
jgi:hypothetical protein